jgi:hypothetical protein
VKCVGQVIVFESREPESPKYADSGDVERMYRVVMSEDVDSGRRM